MRGVDPDQAGQWYILTVLGAWLVPWGWLSLPCKSRSADFTNCCTAIMLTMHHSSTPLTQELGDPCSYKGIPSKSTYFFTTTTIITTTVWSF